MIKNIWRLLTHRYQRKTAILAAALQWYADREAYQLPPPSPPRVGQGSRVEMDGGERARKALKLANIKEISK